MHFEDLDVELLAQRPGHLPDEAASTLTPMLMLPDLTMVARLAASAMSLSFSPLSPVVPMM